MDFPRLSRKKRAIRLAQQEPALFVRALDHAGDERIARHRNRFDLCTTQAEQPVVLIAERGKPFSRPPRIAPFELRQNACGNIFEKARLPCAQSLLADRTLHGAFPGAALRTAEIADGASLVATQPAVREYLTAFIREHMLRAGLSNPMAGLSGLANLYQQSCAVLSIGLRKNPQRWLFSFGDYLLDYIFEKFSCELSAEQAIHRGVYRLMAYDAENATDYIETLKTYIAHQFNASLAAEELFVHRSTFLRRLHRIEEVGGLHLDDPDEILHIMISLRLCQLLSPRQARSVS